MADNTETVRRLRITATSDGLDTVISRLEKLGLAYEIAGSKGMQAAVTEQKATQLRLSAQSALEQQIARADPNFRSQKSFERGMQVATRALEQGATTAAAYKKEVDRLITTLERASQFSLPANAPIRVEARAEGQKRDDKDVQAAARAQAYQDTINKRFGIDRGDTEIEGAATASGRAFAARIRQIEALDRFVQEREAAAQSILEEAKRAQARATIQIREDADLRQGANASRFQEQINQRFGVKEPDFGIRSAAAASGDIFKAEEARLDAIRAVIDQRARAAQDASARAMNFQSSLNQRLGVGAGGAKSAEDSMSAFAPQIDRIERIRDETNPQDAADRRLASRLKEYNELRDQGTFSAKEFANAEAYANRQHELTKRSIDGANVAMGKYASGVGLARHEMVNFSRQAQDVFVSLQAGQSPMTVLIQQGTQIVDIFATSKGSIGGFFIQLAKNAATFAASLTGVAIGVGVLTAGSMAAAYQYSESQRDIERSLNGVGKASGLTADGINRIAESSAAASKISVSSAREIAAAFAGTGKIAPGMTGDLVGLTKNYAAQTGQDRATAAQELGKAFADPLKGADALNEKLGNLDSRTRTYIRTLLEQNDRSGAQKVLLDSVSQAVKGAADNLSNYAKAWNAVARAASDAWNAIGSAGTPASIEDRLAQAQRSLSAQRDARARSGIWSGVTQGDMDQNAAAVDDLGEQARRRGALQASRAAQASAADQSLRVQGLIENVNPQIQELEKFRVALADLESYLKRPLGTMDAKGITEAAEAADRYRNALESAITPLQRIERENMIGIRSINAKTRAEQETVEILRLQLDLAGKLMSSAEREAKIAGEIAKSRAQRVDGILGRTDADGEALRKTRDELETIQLMLAGAIGTLKIDDVERSKDAVDKLTTSVETNLTAFQKRERAGQIAVAAINARTVAERAAVEMARESLNLAGSEITAAERKLAIMQKLIEAQATANRGAQDALRASQDELSMAGLLPAQRSARQREIDSRNLREQFGTGGTPTAANSNIPVVGEAAIPATAGALRGLDAAFAANLQKLMQEFPGLGITSGARTFEQQARLYAQKGPGWAAPPGSSKHETGTAADLNYNGKSTLPDDVYKRAAELGIAFPLKDRANKPEPWHAEPANGRGAGGMNLNNAATLKQVDANKALAASIQEIDGPLKDANMALDAQIRLAERQAQSLFMSTAEQVKMAEAQRLTNDYIRQGVAITPELTAAIDQYATRAGAAAEYIKSVGDAQKSLADLNSLGKDVTKSFVSDIMAGKSAAEAFRGVLDKVASKLIDMAINDLFSKALGGSGGGGGITSLFSGLFGGSSFGGSSSSSFTPQFSGGAELFGPGFSGGGHTGAGSKHDVAGVVHKGEYVFDAKSTSRIGVGVLEAMRRGGAGYAEGGYVAPGTYAASAPAPANSNKASININNYASDRVAVRAEENDNGDYEIMVDMLEGRIAEGVTRGRGSLSMALEARSSGKSWRG